MSRQDVEPLSCQAIKPLRLKGLEPSSLIDCWARWAIVEPLNHCLAVEPSSHCPAVKMSIHWAIGPLSCWAYEPSNSLSLLIHQAIGLLSPSSHQARPAIEWLSPSSPTSPTSLSSCWLRDNDIIKLTHHPGVKLETIGKWFPWQPLLHAFSGGCNCWFAFFLNAGDFLLEIQIHHNQCLDPGVDTRAIATLLLDALLEKNGKMVDREGNAIHLQLTFPLHIRMEGPVNINNGRRGRIAQQHINIHPKSSAEDVNFLLFAKLVAAPCVVGEKSSKVTLVAPRTIVFWVKIWHIAKIVVPLNNTRMKMGRGGILPLQVCRGSRHPRLLPRRQIRPSWLVKLAELWSSRAVRWAT